MAESKSKSPKPTLEALDADAAQAAGFLGRVADPTPNANYTAAQSAAPTPETDGGLAEQAQARHAELGAQLSGEG